MKNSPTLYGTVTYDVAAVDSATVAMNATFTRWAGNGREQHCVNSDVLMCRLCPARTSVVNPVITVTLRGLLAAQTLTKVSVTGGAAWVAQNPVDDTVSLQTTCAQGVACAFALMGQLSSQA